MGPFWPLLTSLFLLASPAVQPAEFPSGWQAAAEQYAGLEPGEQQRRWIGDLVSRLDRANRVVLLPGEAAAEHSQHVVLLRQMAPGRTIPHSELVKLLRQTDEREKAAIERLARRFRIRVYDTFRVQRGEFARRRAAWDQALAAWEAAGAPFEHQDRLIDWLRAAIGRSTPGSVGSLPSVPKFDVPKFGRFAAIPRPLVLRRPGELQTARQPAGGEIQLSGPPLPPAAIVPYEPYERRAVSERAATQRPAAALVRRPAELPLVLGQSAPEGIRPMQPASRGVAGLVAGVGPRRQAGPFRKAAAQPESTLPLSDRAVLLTPPAAAAHRSRATDGPVATASRVAQPPSRSVNRPQPILPAAPAASQPSPPHRVNLAELAVRVAGSNLALQALEAELEESRRWNARRLGPLVDRLEILVMRRNDLALFHQLISARERARVGRLESPQVAISRLAARIFEARTRAGGPGFLGSEAQRRAELRQLDELSRQLAEMASHK